ncbi:4Fe-4S dicluster domain-containing protein [Thermodesulfobacteriota bacterium]
MSTYELIIDHESCWGCRTCEVACKQENHAPDGFRLIKVLEEGPWIINGKPEFTFRVSLCRHCEEPASVEVCPETAIMHRNDGIVVLDEEKCTGCGLCVDACPYDAIELDRDKDVVRKCNLCYHRVDNGLIPACADNICPGHCIYFGTPDEIKNEIKAKHTRRARRSIADTGN